MFIKYIVCMWFLSDFYISTDFGQPVRGSDAHRFPGLPYRHDACYEVFSSVFTQDGGKHNIIPKTGLQVVVADPYDELDLEEKANQKESPRRIVIVIVIFILQQREIYTNIISK